ncbi:CD225/dispanin family protein [Rhodococcus sp. ABRD24]|uniref:CD225/dispanin family protein n=1 Tax=Rhodococcus sp. ABRD24 TaxID=2507582 RepID=UPI001040CEE2|nr:CD225/dispanin family protein [Rhodococcus sp. ABRD24]QBJ97691.1 CD225/dispanin family protein [Rhodococcus sp. ABRD24]
MSEPTYNAPTDQFGGTSGYGQQQPYPSAPQYSAGPTPAQYGGTPPLPPSNAGWAVAAILFFWPVAFAAFNHLHSILPKWSMGDYQGAQYASDRVKTLGKIALGVGIGLIVLFIIMWFIMFAAFAVAVEDAGTSTTYQW